MPLPVILALLLRHALTVAGGALLTRGLIDADTAASLGSEAVVGALATLAAVGWSVAQKLRGQAPPAVPAIPAAVDAAHEAAGHAGAAVNSLKAAVDAARRIGR